MLWIAHVLGKLSEELSEKQQLDDWKIGAEISATGHCTEDRIWILISIRKLCKYLKLGINPEWPHLMSKNSALGQRDLPDG